MLRHTVRGPNPVKKFTRPVAHDAPEADAIPVHASCGTLQNDVTAFFKLRAERLKLPALDPPAPFPV